MMIFVTPAITAYSLAPEDNTGVIVGLYAGVAAMALVVFLAMAAPRIAAAIRRREP